MPLQNRVDPYGTLCAVPERGAWLGNRGVLHDEARRIVAPWRLRRWIVCVLRFKDRQREVFAPRRYSELFFLDEATAFAAGHRPCAECRRERFEEFRAAWAAANRDRVDGERPSAEAIDRVLHDERVEKNGAKKTWRAAYGGLPDGAMIELEGAPHLIHARRPLPWSFAGYARAIAAPAPGARVAVLTPRSIVRAYREGLAPQVDATASG